MKTQDKGQDRNPRLLDAEGGEMKDQSKNKVAERGPPDVRGDLREFLALVPKKKADYCIGFFLWLML